MGLEPSGDPEAAYEELTHALLQRGDKHWEYKVCRRERAGISALIPRTSAAVHQPRHPFGVAETTHSHCCAPELNHAVPRLNH